jgi:hypothetical protein
MVLVGFNRGCCHCYCLVAYCQKKISQTRIKDQ